MSGEIFTHLFPLLGKNLAPLRMRLQTLAKNGINYQPPLTSWTSSNSCILPSFDNLDCHDVAESFPYLYDPWNWYIYLHLPLK